MCERGVSVEGNYKDVEELKAKLREEFFPEADEDEDEVEDTETEEEPVDEEEETVDDDDSSEQDNSEEDDEVEETNLGDEEFNVEEETKKQPTKEEKEQFAFKKLREEANNYKAEYTKKVNELNELNDLAIKLGYKDHREMVEANRKRLQEEEAKRRGIDPAIYNELEELKRKAEESEKRERTSTFVRTLDEFIVENGLTKEDRVKIIQNLEEDNWDLPKLISFPNPKKLLKGYAADLLVERKTQKDLTEKKKKFKENKFEGEETVTEDVIEAEEAFAHYRF